VPGPVAPQPTAAEGTTASALQTIRMPSSGSDALRWAALLPAAAVVYFSVLTLAFAPAFTTIPSESAQNERTWLTIAVSYVIAGWVTLLSSAWIAPARKRSVVYAGYLVFLLVSLPLSGRMLVARGVDTTVTMLGLWGIVVVAVAPIFRVVQRVWGAPAHSPSSTGSR